PIAGRLRRSISVPTASSSAAPANANAAESFAAAGPERLPLLPGADQIGHLLRGDGPADVEALRGIARDGIQELERLLRLDPLGANGEVQVVSELDERLDHDPRLLRLRHAQRQRLVDLHFVERHTEELRQRRIADTEIV